MKTILLAILVGLALTVLLYAVGALLSGGGHDLNAITTFFPYSLSLGILTEDTRWARSGSSIAGALFVLQFPVYAMVFAISKRMLWKWPLIILISLHLLAVLIGLRIYYGSRSSYFNGAIQQALAADRNQRASHRQLAASAVVARPLKAVVRLLSLMKSIEFFLTIVLACSLMTVASAQRQKNRRAGTLVDANKPVVFISFLRSAEIEPLETGVGNRYLWFRITNNAGWPIWLDMSGVPKAYGDAGLFYTIENKDDGKIRIDSRCHACSVNPVGSGRSVVFSIPADYASQDARMRMEYSFAWERDNATVGGSYSKHSVLFYFSYLPKSALPAGAQSNKALQQTAR